ncbi:hypothetical protein ACTGJ9_035860 [Bradyrhizobium sp. RDM12]
MKHVEGRPFADPEAAARKLLELAAGVERINDHIHIEKINGRSSRKADAMRAVRSSARVSARISEKKAHGSSGMGPRRGLENQRELNLYTPRPYS